MDALFHDYEVIRKSGLFDAEYYLSRYPELEAQNIDPLVHYLEEGARQRLDPHPDFDAAFYPEQCRRRGEEPETPLLHFIAIGAARGFKTRRDPIEAGSADVDAADGSPVDGQFPILAAV